MRTAFISHPSCLQHVMIDEHPESPERLMAINDQLMAQQIYDFLRHYDAPAAAKRDLLRVHSENHVEHIFRSAPAPGEPPTHIDPDTYMGQATLDAALHAAGAGILAVDLVFGNEVSNAFCSVRPPGHHAERDQAMGFCFFNNIAIAAAYAMEKHRLERVLIVDFDVHHGNGTEDIFEHDYRVMVCSTYQHPLYPFSGRDTDPGHLINVPLRAGAASPEFRLGVQQHWLPAIETFRPELILISAGFDAHWQDDMASLQFNESDYVWVTKKMLSMADRFCAGRVISMLEGGYVLDALGRCVANHVRTLMRVN